MDSLIIKALEKEKERQENNIELIASENYVSNDILKLQGSILTNKYAEGYPGKRYYGGCENIDVIESLAIDYATKLFGAKYANVQPHSGSSANMAVLEALGGTRLASNQQSAAADRALDKIVDYSKCPKCNSSDLSDATEEEIRQAQSNNGNSGAVSSADELKKYKEIPIKL